MTHSYLAPSSPSSLRPYILSIDLLRALLALGVLFYHGLKSENIGTFSILGYYCVYGFFVISGISLYVTYYDRMSSAADVAGYWLKRIFRIAPLYWTVVIFILLVFGVPGDPSRIWWNVSLLFGFNDPGYQSIVTGGWSIGIELVFYTLFPLILWISRRNLLLLSALTVASALWSLLFVNSAIDASESRMTAGIWRAYIQPQAFFIYFVWGCAWGETYLRIRNKRAWLWPSLIVILLSLCVFVGVDYNSPLELLSGLKGAGLMAATLSLVSAFCFVPIKAGAIHFVALWLGRLSYAIYLLHPQIYRLLERLGFESAILNLALLLGLTLFGAWLTYSLIENPIRKFGKRLSVKLSDGKTV